MPCKESTTAPGRRSGSPKGGPKVRARVFVEVRRQTPGAEVGRRQHEFMHDQMHHVVDCKDINQFIIDRRRKREFGKQSDRSTTVYGIEGTKRKVTYLEAFAMCTRSSSAVAFVRAQNRRTIEEGEDT